MLKKSPERKLDRPKGTIDVFFNKDAIADLSTLIALHHSMDRRPNRCAPKMRASRAIAQPRPQAAALRPEEASIDNRAFTHAMLSAAKKSGDEIFAGKSVTGIVKQGNRCTGLKLENETISAKWTVIAAGIFSAEIDGVKEFAPVRPAKGQMVSLRADGLKIERVIWGEKIYIVPRNDGRILAGATVEYVGFDKQVTAGGIEKILSAAIEVIPEFVHARIEETWAGLRPDSLDHLPIIGPTDIDGLLIATGHFRSGILLTPITARLIRQWITERSVEIDWDRLSPMRFIEARRETTA